MCRSTLIAPATAAVVADPNAPRASFDLRAKARYAALRTYEVPDASTDEQHRATGTGGTFIVVDPSNAPYTVNDGNTLFLAEFNAATKQFTEVVEFAGLIFTDLASARAVADKLAAVDLHHSAPFSFDRIIIAHEARGFNASATFEVDTYSTRLRGLTHVAQGIAYFVTSETPDLGLYAPRFTVRQFDAETGHITPVAEGLLTALLPAEALVPRDEWFGGTLGTLWCREDADALATLIALRAPGLE